MQCIDGEKDLSLAQFIMGISQSDEDLLKEVAGVLLPKAIKDTSEIQIQDFYLPKYTQGGLYLYLLSEVKEIPSFLEDLIAASCPAQFSFNSYDKNISKKFQCAAKIFKMEKK
jgi:hypothetical protein